jgi:cell wall assembly regulator SMI1
MDTVVHSWQRIDAWLETFAPGRASGLRPGVPLEGLALAETKIGLTLQHFQRQGFEPIRLIHHQQIHQARTHHPFHRFHPLSARRGPPLQGIVNLFVRSELLMSYNEEKR